MDSEKQTSEYKEIEQPQRTLFDCISNVEDFWASKWERAD